MMSPPLLLYSQTPLPPIGARIPARSANTHHHRRHARQTARSPTCTPDITMDDGSLPPYDPDLAGLDSHRAKGPVSMRKGGEEEKARCKCGEVPGNCCGTALLIPTITTTQQPQPLPHHTRTFECIFCLHPDSGTGIAPEAEARAYLRKRVRVQ